VNSRTKKFWSYYKPYRTLFVADMLCASIMSAITLILPLCTRYITKDVLTGGTLDQLYGVGLLMLVLLVVQTLSNIFVDYQGHVMGALMERDMRAELFDHYQKLSFSFYDEQRVGQLMTRITNDAFAMGELYHHGPEDFLISVVTFIGALIILATINLPLTLLVLAFIPVMMVYALHFNRKMKIALLRSKDRIGDINAQVEDTLAGIRVVKSFANEETERQKFAYENERFLQSRRDGYRSEAYFFSGLIGMSQLVLIAVIIFGGSAILNASLDLADLLTFTLCVGILIEPIRKLINFTRLYQEGMTGFTRFMDILEVKPDLEDSPDAVNVTSVEGNIEFKDVTFKYREGQNTVLRNISLTIHAGEYIAIVGPSGVGKTTLCSLIPRFYEPTNGEICIDGRDIRTIRQRSLRSHIGVVHQDIYLFAGTVAENIRYGKLGASREEIIAAAKLANAHDFIMALPDGYDTDIGQRGVKLSGGQKQRLSIARVFLKNPPILILDEATSALDQENERAIQNSLERLIAKRTTLVIAHRLSTIRNARRILVLTDNGIEEQGTHDELIAFNNIYANLYNMQIRE